MKTSRSFGLVGGLGVGATIHYYQALAKAHQEAGRTLDIVMAHAETSRVFEYIQANDPAGLAQYLTGFIRRLQAAGAEVAIIPAVTPLFCVRELLAISPLPVVNIFPPLVQEIAARGFRRVAVFGTRFVMESKLFGELGKVEIVPWRPEDLDHIHHTYVELVAAGSGSETQRAQLTAFAHTAIERDGAEAIVLAGTDLSLIFHAKNPPDFPHLDCAQLHLQQILRELLRET